MKIEKPTWTFACVLEQGTINVFLTTYHRISFRADILTFYMKLT